MNFGCFSAPSSRADHLLRHHSTQLCWHARLAGFRHRHTGRGRRSFFSLAAYPGGPGKDRLRKTADRRDRQRSAQAGIPFLLAAVPALGAIAVASFLGKVVLSVVTGAIGIAFFLTAGITAATVLLPATLFIGGVLSVAALLGSLTVGAVVSLAVVGFFAARGRKQKLEVASSRASRNKFEALERKDREEQAELERSRLQREELLDFDSRLRARDRGRQ